ncbi:MAG: cytochrome c biogenesis protein ResB [Planctomycetia bacterium]|nr:cytochrome c biogenesis protein ResB [Planctomycetia bacterium]
MGRRWLGWLGSLRLAVVVLSLYAVTVGWATLVDNRYGATAVAWGIYRSVWFAALNVLLGLNVLCSALVRFPWKKRQIGFLMIHTGILSLMIGSAVTWRGGVDGVIGVFEGRGASRIVTDTRILEVTVDGKSQTIPLEPGPFSWSMLRSAGTDESALSRFPWRLSGNGRPRTIFRDASIRIELVDWLAQVRLVPADDAAHTMVDLTEEAEKTVTPGSSGDFPRWTVETSSPVPVEVTIRPVPFPGKDATRADREAWVDRGLRAARLRVHTLRDGGPATKTSGTPGGSGAGVPGAENPEVEDYWLLLDESEAARFRRMAGDLLTPDVLTDAESLEQVRYASLLTPEMTSQTIHPGNRTVTLSLRSLDVDAGFGVTLRRFDRRFNPGSRQASHYASQIDLTEPDGTMILADQRITMNEPIEFRGVRLFQTSWRGPWAPGHPFYDAIEPVESEESGLYMTVLSANRDPGSGWKYVGSFLLLVGMTIVFVRKAGGVK